MIPNAVLDPIQSNAVRRDNRLRHAIAGVPMRAVMPFSRKPHIDPTSSVALPCRHRRSQAIAESLLPQGSDNKIQVLSSKAIISARPADRPGQAHSYHPPPRWPTIVATDRGRNPEQSPPCSCSVVAPPTRGRWRPDSRDRIQLLVPACTLPTNAIRVTYGRIVESGDRVLNYGRSEPV